MSYYIYYVDDGPNGPCEQDCAITQPWCKLIKCKDRKEAVQVYVKLINSKDRENPRVLKIFEGCEEWSDTK